MNDVCGACTRENEGLAIECQSLDHVEAALRLYQFATVGDATTSLCARCGTRTDVTDYGKVSAFAKRVTKPVTRECLGCFGTGHAPVSQPNVPHTACDGRGYLIVGQHERVVWVYTVCTSCVNELAVGRNRPSGNGYAVVYTTRSRAGEPGNRPGDGQRSRSAKASALCMLGCGARVTHASDVCKRCEKRILAGEIRADMIPVNVTRSG